MKTNVQQRFSEAGISLIALLVATALLSMGALIASRVMRMGATGLKAVELRAEIEGIRQSIMMGIDCRATFDHNGVTNPNSTSLCSSTSALGGQTSQGLMLYRAGTTPRPFSTSGLEPDGSFRMGKWSVRATCSESEQSFVVRIARKNPDGSFQKNPANGRDLDWTFARSLIFGTGGHSLPLCYQTDTYLTTEFAFARRAFNYVAATGNITKSGVLPYPGSPASAFEIVNNATNETSLSSQKDGLRCRHEDGWTLVACAYANGGNVSGVKIRQIVADSTKEFTYDADISRIPSMHACTSDDANQLKDADMSWDSEVHVYITCARRQ